MMAKILPRHLQMIFEINDHFLEFRKNDRNYEYGDTLILHEWVQDVYTGRKVEARITDVTDLSDWLEDYVLLSIQVC